MSLHFLPIAAPAITFDPYSGELYHQNGVLQLTRMRSDLLLMLVRAGGNIVAHEAIEALSRGYGECLEKAARRRSLVHNLQAQLMPLGVEIESRTGFGYRLRGNVALRDMFWEHEPRQGRLELVS